MKVEIKLSSLVLVVAIVVVIILGQMVSVKDEWEAYVSDQVGQTCTIENMYDVNDIQSIEC